MCAGAANILIHQTLNPKTVCPKPGVDTEPQARQRLTPQPHQTRMCVGCLILVGILGLMGGAVWSIVSDAPGDPLHQKPVPTGYTTLPHDDAMGGGVNATAAGKKDNGASMFSWFKGVLKDGGH